MPRWIRQFSVLVFAAAAAGLWTPVPAGGQIDNRVNRGNTATAGRALDANSQVGGTGLNLVPPRQPFPGTYSNAIISGNVSGLGGFHDFSPVIQNNRFRADLPSAGLSGFEGRSVNLPGVIRQPVQTPSYYFGRSETIADLGHIRQGLNRPGTTAIVNPYAPPSPPAVQGPAPGDRELNQLIRAPEDTRVGIESGASTVVELGLRQEPISAGPVVGGGMTGRGRRDPYRSAVDSSLFGVPRPTPLNRGIAGLSTAADSRFGFRPFAPDAREDEYQGLPADRRRTGDAIDAMVNAPVDGLIDTAVGTDADRVRLPGAAGESADTAPPGERPFDSTGPATDGGAVGGDLFSDLYGATVAAQAAGLRQVPLWSNERGEESAEGADGATNDAAPTDGPAPGSAQDAAMTAASRSEVLRRLGSASRWAADLLENPIQTFVGRYENELNRNLAEGEAALKRSEYYRAAGYFELASTIDPANPLPYLARGHALAAAGDYMSAVAALQRGIERFPQIAAFRIDLPSIVGRSDIFDIRRADLEKRLEWVESYELRFLLGYLEYYSGLPEDGLADLRRAAESAPPDDVISQFAGMLTGERELPTLDR